MELTDKDKKEFISIVNAKVELEKLSDYINDNQDFLNSLCLNSIEMPFNVEYHSTNLLITFIENFKNNKIVKK